VAFETIYDAFKTAVVVYKPYQLNSTWVSKVAVLDSSKGTAHIYTANLPDQNNAKLVQSITGAVYQADDMAVNFAKVKDMAVSLKYSGFAPDSVDQTGSFVSFHSSDSVDGAIKEIVGGDARVQTLPSVDTWPALVDAMKAGKLNPQLN
jgi:hypothetical protein